MAIPSERIGEDGRVLVHPAGGGPAVRCWPVDAVEMLAAGASLDALPAAPEPPASSTEQAPDDQPGAGE